MLDEWAAVSERADRRVLHVPAALEANPPREHATPKRDALGHAVLRERTQML